MAISYSDTVQLKPFDTIPPSPPVLRFASVEPNRSVKISWNRDKNSDVKFYELWRDQADSNFNKLTTITYDSIFFDTSADQHSTPHAYFLRAIDSCNVQNRSIPSDTDRIIIPGVTTGASVPLANIQWSPYHDLPQKVDKYTVLRSENGSRFRPLVSLPDTTTIYVDSSLNKDYSYCFKIKAIDNNSGYFALSDSVCITPWIFPVPGTSQMIKSSIVKTESASGSIRLVWQKADPSDTFARSYKIYHTLNPSAGNFTMIKDEENLNDTTFIHKNINTKSQLHYYYLTTYNLCNKKEGTSSNIHRPVNLSARNNNLAVSLQWSHYRGFPVKSYQLYRSVNGNAYSLVKRFSPNILSFIDSNVHCDNTYSYRIKTTGIRKDTVTSLSDTIKRRVFDTIPPGKSGLISASVNKTSYNNGKIDLKFRASSTSNRKGYILKISTDGQNFYPVYTILDVSSGQLRTIQGNLNTAGSIHWFYFSVIDSCENVSIPSDTHRIIHANVSAVSNANVINWNSYQGWKDIRYQLEKRRLYTNWKTVTNWLDSSNHQFNDSMVQCDSLYFYRVKGKDPATGNIIYSNIDSISAFETDSPLAPLMHRVSVTKNNHILIKWNPSTTADVKGYNIYRRRSGYSSWDFTGSVFNGSQYIDSTGNPSQIPLEYRIESIDSYSNTSPGYSPPHRTILLNTEGANQQAGIYWTPYEGWQVRRYEIIRDGTMIGSVPEDSLTFTDTLVTCTTHYSYRIRAIADSSTRIFSYSNVDSVKPFDNKAPATPYLIKASVIQQGVELMIQRARNFDIKQYDFSRHEAGIVELEKSGSITGDERHFTDTLKGNLPPMCYFVRARDYCKNTSKISNEACIIILKGKADSMVNHLEWNNYKYWKGGVTHYNIYRSIKNESFELIDTVDNKTLKYADKNFPYHDSGICYLVEATGYTDPARIQKQYSRSTVLCLKQPPLVHIPNSFSPTQTPGLNNYFEPEGMFIKSYRMKIFNRWGQKVYETENSKHWDGTFHGNAVQEGIYLYRIIVKSFDNKSRIYQGNIMVFWE